MKYLIIVNKSKEVLFLKNAVEPRVKRKYNYKYEIIQN